MAAVPERAGAWTIGLADQAAVERFAAGLAPLLKPGDMVTLSGGLGAGKTTFARALIRQLANDPTLEVPSPTYTLIQSYDGATHPIVHADLYRIASADELDALGWDEAGDGALFLVEWADRAGDRLPADRLDIALDIAGDAGQARTVTLRPRGALAGRLHMAEAIHAVIEAAGFGDATRQHLQGDASSRAYERLVRANGESAILMIAPRRPDGPPVRNGKPYSQIARLAEDVKPFVALAKGLSSRGFSAPEIFAADLDAGLLVIEDFGAEGVIAEGEPMAERYLEAVATLAALHQFDLPATLPVDGVKSHAIPPYDLAAMLIECELLLDWYLPHTGRTALSANARSAFVELWTAALTPLLARPTTWTLRDFHSPNLIWLEGRDGIRRVGLLDFQDCVLGPAAYDVVSLSQDARIDVPDDLELRLVSHYVRLRLAADPAFDPAQFAADYALMGAERATKILGIFARLNARDGKPGYLKHLPRIERNVRRCLLHPALAGLAAWYRQHIPALFQDE